MILVLNVFNADDSGMANVFLTCAKWKCVEMYALIVRICSLFCVGIRGRDIYIFFIYIYNTLNLRLLPQQFFLFIIIL